MARADQIIVRITLCCTTFAVCFTNLSTPRALMCTAIALTSMIVLANRHINAQGGLGQEGNWFRLTL